MIHNSNKNISLKEFLLTKKNIMKKTFLYTLFFVAIINVVVIVNLHPQITIGNNHVPVFGDQLIVRNVDTTGINQGSSGANQTWNFSSINVLTDSASFNWVDPSTTPYASSFPSATIAEGNPAGFLYYTIAGGDMSNIGSGFGTSPQLITILTDPEIIFKIPFTYTNTYTDNFSGTMTGVIPILRRGTITKTADGYGTIILPSGTHNNVLRINFLQDITDSIAGIPIVTRTVTDNYSWYSSQYKFPIFSVTHSTIYTTGSPINSKTVVIATLNTSVGVVPIGNQVVSKYKLNQNYPNPFNPSTSITFDIVKTSDVKLIVYDALGREVAELVNERLLNGSYKVDFNSSNLTSGVYFYKLSAGDFSETKAMMLVK